MNTRILGTCGIIASPMLLISSVRSGFDTANSDNINTVLGLVFLAGWACSLIGLFQLRAADTGGARLLLGVLGVGLILAAVQQVQDLTLESSRFNSRLYQVADALWPLSVAFMLVIGGVVARARVWSGWRRWAPMLCGAALPLLFGVQAVAGRKAAAVVFGIYTTAAWGLLGWAVLTSRERSQL